MDYIKKLISYLPQNNTEEPPKIKTDDDPNRLDHNLINIIPDNPLQPYDMKEIINSVVDNHEFSTPECTHKYCQSSINCVNSVSIQATIAHNLSPLFLL